MTFAKQAVGLLGLMGILALGAHIQSRATPTSIHFDEVLEVQDLARANGLVVHSGNGHGLVEGNCFLADHPVTFDDLLAVCDRRHCGLTPAWRGIVWVCQINGSYRRLHAGAIGGKTRIWGNVLAAGDEELMDRIERHCHSR
jgi:hypothetical protein